MSLRDASQEELAAVFTKVAADDPRTQSLDLSQSKLFVTVPSCVDLAADLVKALKSNTKLTALNLSRCNLDDEAAATICAHLHGNKSIFHLDLSCNPISDAGLIEVAGMLQTNVGMRLDGTGREGRFARFHQRPRRRHR